MIFVGIGVGVVILALLFQQTFQVEGWSVRPGEVARQVGQVQVLPLLLGLLLRQRLPRLAQRLEVPLERLANLLLLLLVVVLLLKAGPLLIAAVLADPAALLAMAVLITTSLGLGCALGGWSSQEGLSTALVTSMRNPGLALLFAGNDGQDLPGLKVWILTYVLLTVLISVPLVQWSRRRAAR